MAQNNTEYSDWGRAVIREAAVRRGLVLYGNMRDLFYDPQERQYTVLPELLTRIFTRERSLGFTMTGQWDQVDGLRFPDQRMLSRFQDAVRKHLGGQRSKARTGEHYDLGDRNTAPSQETQQTGFYSNPSELLSAMRAVFASNTEQPAFILDWNQLLVGQAAHLDADERRWMLDMGKALVGEPIVSMNSDALKQSNGLLVLLTTSLGMVPPILYQGEPRIRLISVPPPTRPERKAFFLRHADDLQCERPRPASGAAPAGAGGSGREELADTLADLTDQLTFTDLRQILSLSMHTESTLPPERLLNLYRLGDQRSPWEDLSEEKLRDIEPTLKKRVVGQDQAVQHVATMVIRAYMGLAGLQHSALRSKPKGTLFFVGPTGVGKTELAKALAEVLFGDEAACIRMDMSEYNHEHSDQRLIGAPPGYVGFEEGGQLTNAVRERPFCVLLFDEIEKAHPRILDKFLQILEDGRLTDGRGETTYFSECVIIFTSNIGAAESPTDGDPETIRNHFTHAVEDHFVRQLGRPELLNRLGDNVVVFQPIKDDSFRRAILERKIAPLQNYLQERFGVELRISESVESRYLQSARSEHGGRGVVNALERDLLNPLARFLFSRAHQLRSGRKLYVGLEGDEINFDLQEA